MLFQSMNAGRKSRLWFLAVAFAFSAAFGAVTLFDSPLAVAQFDENAAPPAGGAAPPPANGGAAAPAAGNAETPPQTQSTLSWLYNALGIEYTVVFLGLSFTFVALLVMNMLTARRPNVAPIELVEAFEAQLNEKRYQEAYEMAKTDESVLGQVLSAGLAKLSSGYAKALESMQEVGEDENMKIQHRLSYLALIGSIAPMVGLFGTVDGMIRSFSVLVNATGAPSPAKLAEGISTALVTTLLGLAIAIPAIAAFSILKNRMQRLMLEVGILSEGLMSRFEAVGVKK